MSVFFECLYGFTMYMGFAQGFPNVRGFVGLPRCNRFFFEGFHCFLKGDQVFSGACESVVRVV